MERYTIEVRDDMASSLRDAAQAEGVSVEETLIGLVTTAFASRDDHDWVHDLIAMTRPGIEINQLDRQVWERMLPFEYDDFS